MSMRYVIGVAGAAGAGKTTLVQALVANMQDAAALHIDNYQQITRQPVDKLMQWMERGADFDEFSIPALPADLEKLKRGEPIRNSITGAEIASRKYIVFETHFGRAHRATGRYIDLLIWIDTPLDIALARNVRDFLRPALQTPPAQAPLERVAWVHNYIDNYLANVRQLVSMQHERVGADADIVLDGSANVADAAERIVRDIRERLP
jgi:uridine kinase